MKMETLARGEVLDHMTCIITYLVIDEDGSLFWRQ